MDVVIMQLNCLIINGEIENARLSVFIVFLKKIIKEKIYYKFIIPYIHEEIQSKLVYFKYKYIIRELEKAKLIFNYESIKLGKGGQNNGRTH